jgi:hypothetical protein
MLGGGAAVAVGAEAAAVLGVVGVEALCDEVASVDGPVVCVDAGAVAAFARDGALVAAGADADGVAG